MAWTPEGPTPSCTGHQEIVRQGMLVRLAAMIDTIHPLRRSGDHGLADLGPPGPCGTWPATTAPGAGCRPARRATRAGVSRLMSWRCQAVLDRAPRVTIFLPPPRGRSQAPADGRHHRHAERADRPPAWPARVRRQQESQSRKRVLVMVDTQGDPLGVQVVSADGAGPRCAHALAPDLDRHPVLAPGLAGSRLRRRRPGCLPAGPRRPRWSAPSAARVQVEPRRWKVEQTFGCLQLRRLRVDDEATHDTSRQMTILASVFMTGMRLQLCSRPEQGFRRALNGFLAEFM